MSSFGNHFLLSFVPLFVAIDALGSIPLVLGLLRKASPAERRRVINLALTIDLVFGIGFLFFGRLLPHYLSIKVGHFSTAGGLVLPAAKEEPAQPMEKLAVVPLATPFIAGPATLTSLLIS